MGRKLYVCYTDEDGDDCVVAEIDNINRVAPHDAELIAAAPDLYETLLGLVCEMSGVLQEREGVLDPRLAKARAALSRATPQEPREQA